VSQPAHESDPPVAAPAYPQAIHLRPTAELAERVLLPGDPGRALALAQTLLVKPLMFNHHRGLWGYTGDAVADGEPLTIQATGMGGPSAAIVLTELISLGARRLIRTGTSGSTRRRVHSGAVVSVDLFYDSRSLQHSPDALAIEMEAASLFAVGAAASVPVACILIVSDTFERNDPHPPTRTRIDDDSLLAAGEAMGAVAVSALSA